jgi:hypothetical protein
MRIESSLVVAAINVRVFAVNPLRPRRLFHHKAATP